MVIRKATFVLIVGLGLSGCYSRAEMQTKLRTQASSDLECPADELNVYEMTDSQSLVNGCGRKKSYIGVCAHFECKWINNDGETVAEFFKANTRPVTTAKPNVTTGPTWKPSTPQTTTYHAPSPTPRR